MAKRLASSLANLPPKLRTYAKCRLDGMTQKASAAAAGSKDPGNDGTKWERDERVQAAMVAAAEDLADEVGFTRKEAHDLLMRAYENATTSGEMTQAVNAMISLHGLAKPKEVHHKHDHEHTGQIEHMSDSELLKLAQMDDLTLEGEYEVVKDDEIQLIEAPEVDERSPDDY